MKLLRVIRSFVALSWRNVSGSYPGTRRVVVPNEKQGKGVDAPDSGLRIVRTDTTDGGKRTIRPDFESYENVTGPRVFLRLGQSLLGHSVPDGKPVKRPS